jgi:hypothetical protein
MTKIGKNFSVDVYVNLNKDCVSLSTPYVCIDIFDILKKDRCFCFTIGFVFGVLSIYIKGDLDD